MASPGGKNWWEQDLEWSLGGSMLPALNSGLKPISKVIVPRGLAKAPSETTQPEELTPGKNQVETNEVETKPVVRPVPPLPQRPAPPPRPSAPPQPAAQAPLAAAQPVRAVTFPPPKPITAQTAKACEFTLEQLLDPDFCGYVRKDS